jgi:type IV pilus assembly protein PilY1
LWEFTDPDLGYTYGNPVIGKLASGAWVVFVTSGLNNTGTGYLYVIDAISGTLLHKIATSAGSASSPSGLNKLVGWVNIDARTDLTYSHLYGADLLGNVWRFDVNDQCNYGTAPNITQAPCDTPPTPHATGTPAFPPAGLNATLLITVKDGAGNPQPITTRPIAALVGNDIRVFVGTGKFISTADQIDAQVQAVYGFKDPLTSPSSGAVYPNGRSSLAQRTLIQTGSGLAATRSIQSCTPNTNGWFVELPDHDANSPYASERVNVDMRRAFNSLIFASNIPESSACSVGGRSWLNTVNLQDGCMTGVSSVRVANALVVGISLITVNGAVKAVVQLSDGTTPTEDPRVTVSPPLGKRQSWREVTKED